MSPEPQARHTLATRPSLNDPDTLMSMFFGVWTASRRNLAAGGSLRRLINSDPSASG
jgi:hypothetical protein